MNKKGIDVSAHQGVINWTAVKNSGIDFAIIRAGYGTNTVDRYFKANIEGAIKAGLAIGVYWFMYALTVDQARANAQMFIKAIAPYKNHINLKAYCDFEYDTDDYAKKHNVYFTKETRTAFITTFCEELKANGYDAGVYLNPDYIRTKVNKMNYPLWLAQYASKKSYDCIMWQHSSKGRVGGINGNVDLDILYSDLPTTVAPTTPTPTEPVVTIGNEQFSSNYRYGKNYKVTASALNVRAGYGTSSKVKYSIPKGTVVTWYGFHTVINGTMWKKVLIASGSHAGEVGYVCAKYLA